MADSGCESGGPPQRIAPCILFSIDQCFELWRATGKDTAIGMVIMPVARAINIAGTCTSLAAPAYVRQRSVRPEVLLSDLASHAYGTYY